MFETLIGLGIVALFTLAAWAAGASAEVLIVTGLGLAAVGFAYGLPAAAVYHWLFYRALVDCDRLPARWWLSPTSHHDRIPLPARRRVLLWAALGGSGFVAIVVGILLTSFGLWRARAV